MQNFQQIVIVNADNLKDVDVACATLKGQIVQMNKPAYDADTKALTMDVGTPGGHSFMDVTISTFIHLQTTPSCSKIP